MFKDEIVEEIHRIRQEYSRSFNHDLKAMFTDLQKQQDESGREFVNLSPKGNNLDRQSRKKLFS